MQLPIASHAQTALNTLKAQGFDAYIVGGAVRDLLRGCVPADYDIATNARPADVKRLFSKCIPTGEKHGTVTVIIDGRPIEITTYRVDGPYFDARHPGSVSFSATIDDDVSRRDFTINAMAYDGETLLDRFGGQRDLENGIIQTVGDPYIRFSEDALRILRAFRFAAVLHFQIAPPTLQAAIEKAPLLQNISRERIYTELTKTLCGLRPQALQPLLDCGGLQFLHIGAGALAVLSETAKLPELRYAAFCRLCGVAPDLLLAALHAPKKVLLLSKVIYDFLNSPITASKPALKQQLALLPQPLWMDVLHAYSIINRQDMTKQLQCAEEIIRNKEPYTIAMLQINGNDLRALGASGRETGKLLQKLLSDVVKDPAANQKEHLIELAKKLLGS